MKRIWRVWRRMAHGIVTAQNTVLLLVVFVFGIGPTAILARLTRRRLLDRASLPPEQLPGSHWLPLRQDPADLHSAQRPF